MVQLDSLSEAHLDRMLVLKAVTDSEAGIELMRWLCKLTGFGQSSNSLEDAARRDVWLTLRQYMPVERLAEIEHHELREAQLQLRELLASAQETQGEKHGT